MTRQPHTRILSATAALVSLFIFAVSTNLLPAALLRAAAEMRVSAATLATVGTVQFIGFIVSSIVGGLLSDYIGKQRVFQIAALAMLAGAVLWGLARSLSAAYTAGFLLGLGGGVLESMGAAVLCDLYPRRRKLAMNISQVIFIAGAAGGPWMVGVLLPLGVPWRGFFLAVGAMSAALFVLHSFAGMPAPHDEDRITPARAREIVCTWRFALPCVVLMLYVLPETSVIFYANLYLRERLHAPESWAIFSIAAIWLAMAVGRIVCALIPERVAYEKVIAVLLVLAGTTVTLQSIAGGWQLSFGLFTLAGLFFAGTWPLIIGMAAQRHPQHSGTVMGITIAAGSLGCVGAPLFMNALLATLPTRMTFVAVAVPLFLAAALLLPGLRARGQ